MKSIMKKNCAIVALVLISTDNLQQGVQAVQVNSANQNTNYLLNQVDQTHKNQASGIFSKMIESVTEEETTKQHKDEIKERKRQQLAEAEREHDQAVKEEEQEEALKRKDMQEEAEARALESVKSSASARMADAANSAASQINMSEIEASIQADLAAKLQSGVSKSELLASVGSEDLSSTTPPMTIMNIATASNNVQSAGSVTQSASNVNDIMAKVLHKKPVVAKPAPALIAAPVMLAPIAAPVVVMQKPIPVIMPRAQPVASMVQTTTATSADVTASQDKVKEMASKLGVPLTPEILALKSNSAISDALIDKAVSLGKSETQINSAMSSI